MLPPHLHSGALHLPNILSQIACPQRTGANPLIWQAAPLGAVSRFACHHSHACGRSLRLQHMTGAECVGQGFRWLAAMGWCGAGIAGSLYTWLPGSPQARRPAAAAGRNDGGFGLPLLQSRFPHSSRLAPPIRTASDRTSGTPP